MKKSLIAALVSFYVPFAGAAVFDKLIDFTNDRTSIVNELDMSLNSSGVVQGVAYFDDIAGAKTEKDLSLAQLGNSGGAVLEAQQGVNAILLSGTVNNSAGTGKMTVHYIYNGLSGEYKTCDFNVARNGAGVWTAINVNTNQPISSVKIITYSIGIQTIQGLCAN